jgi:hypothetical protein
MRYEVLVKSKNGKTIEFYLFSSYDQAIKRMEKLEDKYWSRAYVEFIDHSSFSLEKRNKYAYGK